MTHLVLVLVLAAVVKAAEMCTSGIAVTCEGPPNATLLGPETRDLTLGSLNAEQLEEFLAEINELNLPYLHRLTLERSSFPDLMNLTFSFDELRWLKLSGNGIAELPQLNVTSLVLLDLSNNEVAGLGESFRTLLNLQTLNLSANFLTLIDSGGFSGLVSLKCLDLSSNNLTSLDGDEFIPLQSLQYLNLSSNKLQVLNERCFINLVKLQHLDLSLNRLVRVELGSLQLPSLSRLVLSGNPKLGSSHKPVLFVGTGQRLQTVEAANIGLKKIPEALTHSIRTLRLTNNSIKTVRCGDLDSYPLLQLLDFNSNNLQSIEDDALGRLDSLSILYLTNNNLSDIPRSLPEKLQVLHLEQNQIQQVRSKDLQGLGALEVLLLNDNKIRLIEADAFNQLTSLVTLDISNNPIKLLSGCLSRPMALQVLRLANIAVVSTPKEVSFPLSSMEHLVSLDLEGSPGLAKQLLVDTAALAASKQLQELDLSNTELEEIRSDLLHFLPQLRMLRIEGNRINCSQLEWLAGWMRRQDEPEYRRVTCASPADLWGTPLIDLQESEPQPTTTSTQLPETTVEIQPLPVIDKNANESKIDSNNKSATVVPEVHSVTSALNSNSSRTEMSMFSAEERGKTHSGLLFLAGALLGTSLVMTLLAVRFTRRRRTAWRLQQEEVNNLPGVTELW